MASLKPVEESRAVVRKRQAAVGAKISRMKKSGANIAGTEFDPRRDPKLIARYNMKQLADYKVELDRFMNRGTQFVATRKGAPVPIQEWRAYKRAETSYNKATQRAYDKIKDTQLPNSQLTVDQFQKMINPPVPGRNFAGIDTPYRKVNRSSKNIENRKAVQALTKQLNNRQDSNYMKSKSRIARELAIAGLSNLHNPDLVKRIQLMPERQFQRLSKYTNFMEDVTLARYPADSMGDDMRAAEAEKMETYLSWAEDTDDAIIEARRGKK